jgi:two-component system alkaline phosphatase synthesis response regulator PhoP
VPEKILVVEDEPTLVETLEYNLRRQNYDVVTATDGRQALEVARREKPDGIILDVMLPGIDGFEVCRRIRASYDVPVVMLTARGDDADRIVGLEIGADDYIVKPFSPKEFAARVKAILRRVDRSDEADDALAIGPVRIDRARHTVTEDGKAVHLTAKEFSLLVALADAKGRVLSRDRLLEDIWGYSYIEGMRTIDVHVRRLREKLPSIAARIASVKPIGYRLAEPGEGG